MSALRPMSVSREEEKAQMSVSREEEKDQMSVSREMSGLRGKWIVLWRRAPG